MEQKIYYTAILRFVEPEQAHLRTEWHPTNRLGPFSLLSRGVFDTAEKAHAWCKEKGIHPSTYTLRSYSYLDDGTVVYDQA